MTCSAQIFIGWAGHLLTGNCRNIVTGVIQDIKTTPTEILIEFDLHAGEVIGIGTYRSRLISAP
jgi:hypothetical protein